MTPKQIEIALEEWTAEGKLLQREFKRLQPPARVDGLWVERYAAYVDKLIAHCGKLLALREMEQN